MKIFRRKDAPIDVPVFPPDLLRTENEWQALMDAADKARNERAAAELAEYRREEAEEMARLSEYVVPVKADGEFLRGPSWIVLSRHVEAVEVRVVGRGPELESGYRWGCAVAGKSVIALRTTSGRELTFQCWPAQTELAMEQLLEMVG